MITNTDIQVWARMTHTGQVTVVTTGWIPGIQIVQNTGIIATNQYSASEIIHARMDSLQEQILKTQRTIGTVELAVYALVFVVTLKLTYQITPCVHYGMWALKNSVSRWWYQD